VVCATEEAQVDGDHTDARRWRKSSFSGSNDCVEVAIYGHEIGVRDSKRPSDISLMFNVNEWRAFLAGVRNGEFDA
jgi:hypothetical protein